MEKEYQGCVCGMCEHHTFEECKNSECECCNSFHTEQKNKIKISETA